jgi:5-methylthioadenosine/S-adenosylhomocysteine deaminase
MIETLKLTALAQRAAQCRSDIITASEAVALATEGSAQALGQEQRLGVLKPGHQADIAVYRLDTARTVPVHDPLASVVFSAGAEYVETVIVAGQVILENQSFITVDEEKLLAEARGAARALVARAAIV